VEIEPLEIVGLLYSAIMGPHDAEQLFRFEELIHFLSPRVEWIPSTADPLSEKINSLGGQSMRGLLVRIACLGKWSEPNSE
jgi:hypothetical protein